MQYSGNLVTFQIGKESSYGAKAIPTQQIAISSESLKPIYNKVDEGLATGGRGEGKSQTMGRRASGNISTLMRPDMGLILELVCGNKSVEGTEEPYTHTYTASSPMTYRPSATLIIDRGAGVYAYPGSKINSIALSASAGDYAKLDIEFNAKSQNEGTKASLGKTEKKAFRFAGAKMKMGNAEAADITSIKINWNNNDDVETQTTGTGENYLEPQHGVRQITIDTEQVWNAQAKSMIEEYYETDETVSIEAIFTSDEKMNDSEETPYQMKVLIPYAQCTDATANMGSPTEFMKQTMSWKAIDNLSDELCTITLINDEE